eukprot:70296-Rhodomonas_salina.2
MACQCEFFKTASEVRVRRKKARPCQQCVTVQASHATYTAEGNKTRPVLRAAEFKTVSYARRMLPSERPRQQRARRN